MPDEHVDALFQLPLAEFIGARNKLSARLRKEKDAAAAAAVKALVKPSVPAWVVNQLYWNHRDDFDRLLVAGERMRADQQRGLQGGRSSELQAATTERREAITGLLRRAELVLAEDGRSATPATLKRVETTFEAIAALGGAGPDAQLGRLSSDLEPPGFDALLALAAAAPLAAPPPAPPKKPTPKSEGVQTVQEARDRKKAQGTRSSPGKKVGPDPEDDRRAQREAQAAVAEAVERLEQCRQDAGEAEAARAAASARVRQTVAEVSQAKRRLGQAEKHAEKADVNLKRAEACKETAEEEVARAQDSLAAAREAAERVRGS